jgi:hypothetical protein
MYKTSTEDVYTLAAMTADDIRDAGTYSVGTVSTSTYTNPSNYVEVLNYANDGSTTGYVQSKLTDSSKLYTLAYNSDLYKTAALTEDDASVVLNEKGDKDTVNNTYANNTVLVAYNSSNQVVYAVSFANYNGKDATGTAMVIDYAQTAYDNVLPAAAETVTVKFFGQTVTAGGAKTVAYADATGTPLVVTGGAATNLTSDDLARTIAGYGPTTLTVYGNDGKFYSYTLTQDAAHTNATLYSDSACTTEVTKTGTQNQYSFDQSDSVPKLSDVSTLAGFLNKVYTKENATTSVTFTLKGDSTVYGDEDLAELGHVSTTMVSSLLITVTAEDGIHTSVYRTSGADYVAEAKVLASQQLADFTSTYGTKASAYADDQGLKDAIAALQKQIDDATTVDDVNAFFQNGILYGDNYGYLNTLLNKLGGYNVVLWGSANTSGVVTMSFQKSNGDWLTQSELETLFGWTSSTNNTTVAQKFLIEIGTGSTMTSPSYYLGKDLGKTSGAEFVTLVEGDSGVVPAGAGAIKVKFTDTTTTGNTNGAGGGSDNGIPNGTTSSTIVGAFTTKGWNSDNKDATDLFLTLTVKDSNGNEIYLNDVLGALGA